MRAHRTLVTVGLAASAVCFTSFAMADDPSPSKSKCKQPSSAETSPGPEPEVIPPAPPVTPPPPPAQTTVSTTRTTSAEYNEMAGAEKEKTTTPNRAMLGTGAIIFGAPYVAGVIVAAQSSLHEDHNLYIPVVGPWLDLGQRPCGFGSNCSNGDNVAAGFLVASGVAQGAGVLLMLGSLAVPEHHTETVTTTTGKALPPPPPKNELHVMPVSYAGGGGVGAAGSF
jgi:hypothetical protein